MEENYEIESSNIHSRWLDNIYESLIKIQEMETLSLEGCNSLAEFMEIPMEMIPIVIPEIQYKNIRFMTRELKLLIDNLSPILKSDLDKYLKQIKAVTNNINKRELFLKSITKNNKLVELELTPIFYKTIEYLSEIKSGLIKNNKIMKILYYEEEKKKW